MPEKKTAPNGNESILIAEIKFIYAERANNQQLLELCLTKLMKLANEHYDAVYLKYKNNPDIEKFSFCKENFKRIKSIIEAKEPEITSQLIKKFHLEAWISTIYSDVHALNLEPETEDQLNELNEKIQAIETDFNQLLTEISSLDSNDTGSARLLNYIDDFRKTWETKKNMLKGHFYYNFAEILVGKANEELETNKRTFLEDAKHYFMQSADFYKQANLFKFEAQTEQRIKELERSVKELQDSSDSNHFASLPDKKLVVVLTRLSPSLENKGIKTDSVWTASYKEASNEIQPTLGNKRKSSDNTLFRSVKKLKKELSISSSNNELATLWATEREKILSKFKDLKIDINLAHLSNNEKSFDERRAITHNNYAIFLIENLNNAEKSYSDSEKIAFLKKVEALLKKSAEFYNKNANIFEKKDAIEQCINTLKLSIKNLTPIASINEKPSSDKKKASNGKLDLPIRYTRAFFKSLSCEENNATHVDNQHRFR